MSKLSQNRLVWVRFYGDTSNKGEAFTENHTPFSPFRDNSLVKNLFLKTLYLRKKTLIIQSTRKL